MTQISPLSPARRQEAAAVFDLLEQPLLSPRVQEQKRRDAALYARRLLDQFDVVVAIPSQAYVYDGGGRSVNNAVQDRLTFARGHTFPGIAYGRATRPAEIKSRGGKQRYISLAEPVVPQPYTGTRRTNVIDLLRVDSPDPEALLSAMNAQQLPALASFTIHYNPDGHPSYIPDNVTTKVDSSTQNAARILVGIEAMLDVIAAQQIGNSSIGTIAEAHQVLPQLPVIQFHPDGLPSTAPMVYDLAAQTDQSFLRAQLDRAI